jgi:hypothetical protein
MRRIKLTFIDGSGKRQTKTVTAEFTSEAVLKLEESGILVHEVINSKVV